MDKLLERFFELRVSGYPIKSRVRQVPSTEGQWKLLHLLKEQLEEMGLINVTLSEKGTLMATLPANVPAISRRLALFLMWIPHRIAAAKCESANC